jgi:O-antigen ligase
VPPFERISKNAAVIAVIAIALAQIGIHPDMTPALQVLATLAIAAGWLAAGASREWVHAAWVVLALLSPALLRLAAGREGPVLDVFWMAGLTASLLRTSPWSRWSLGDGSQLLAGGWALTLVLSWPVFVARETGFDWRLLFDLGAINSWGLRSAPQVVSWITFVVWTQLLGLLWLDWLAGRFAQAPERTPPVLHGLWIGATLASLVALYQGVVDMAWLNTPQWTGYARATGTILDANAYGVCAALAGPSAALALHGSRSKRTGALIVLILVINVTGLWMSGSRTATVCGIIGVAAVALARWQSAGARGRRVMPIAAAGAAIVIAALALAGGAIGPAKRLLELPPGGVRTVVSEVLHRGPYGATSVAIIRDYPLTGVGVGSYQDIAPDYWRRMADQVLPFDHAQNWWRHEAAELGLVGSLTLFVWSALIAWRVLMSRPASGRTVQGTLVRGLLLAIGIGSIIQVPTQTPVVLLWFFLLVAWLPSLIVKPHVTIFSGARTLVAALAIVYAAGHLVLARGPLAVAERAKAFGREYVAGAYRPEPLPDAGQFRWTDEEARFIWPAPTRWLVVRVWAHHPDIAKDPVRVTITTPCGTLIEQVLDDPENLSVGVMLPEGQSVLEATVKVSRTWQPSAFGGDDRRRLGVGITADPVATREEALATHVPVELGACPAGL